MSSIPPNGFIVNNHQNKDNVGRKGGQAGVGAKISLDNIRAMVLTKEKYSTVSFIWEVQVVKNILEEETVSPVFNTRCEENGHLLWKIWTRSRLAKSNNASNPEIEIGLQLANECMHNGQRQITGVYSLNIVAKDWRILHPLRTAKPIRFLSKTTNWHSLCQAHQLDQYLIDNNILRIHLELVIKTGLEHRQVDPKTGKDVEDEQ